MMKEIVLKENNNLDLYNYVNSFLDYIDVSNQTVITYKNGLKMFFIYCKENNIKNPTRSDIISFREHIKLNHKPTTVNSYMIATRNFYKWLEYEGITKDISKNIKGMVIGNEHKRESLSIEQCKTVLENAKDLREKTLFILTVSCGLRANELVNIQIEDFKEKNGKMCLYVLGKARDYKQDYVIVPDETINILKEYIKEYKINNYLFVSSSNHNNCGKLTTKTIRLIIKNMFKRVGIVGNEYSCHSLRHSFATIAIQNGTDIREVSQALRHKSLMVTQNYLHDLDRLNNKCSNTVSNMLFS